MVECLEFSAAPVFMCRDIARYNTLGKRVEMDGLRKWRFEMVCAFASAFVSAFAALAHADDAGTAAIGNITDAAESLSTSVSELQAAKLGDETKPLPPGFPGRLVSRPGGGLRLKSLEIVGVPAKKSGGRPSVKYEATFVWGRNEIAQQDWESPIRVFLITFNEKTQEQIVHEAGALLRIVTGNPINAGFGSGAELPENSDGCWITVIIVGRDSATERERLLANHTEFVPVVSAGNAGTSRIGSGLSDP